MSEEIDLSQFDDIPDRVARGKAKAEAIKKMREGGASDPPSAPVAEEKPAEAPPPDEAAPAEEAPVAAASEGGGEPEVDLSEFDSITDRVARGKAKAEAMRKARSGGGGATGGAAPAKKAPAKKATSGTRPHSSSGDGWHYHSTRIFLLADPRLGVFRSRNDGRPRSDGTLPLPKRVVRAAPVLQDRIPRELRPWCG